MRRSSMVAMTAALVSILVFPMAAQADSTNHSQHIALAPVGDAPLQSGFVENIHANGPNVFAHEVYVVNGGVPGTSFQVTILLFPLDPSCSSSPLALPTATLDTNAAGNGQAQAFFTPADAAALRHATHGAIWQLAVGGVAVYQTACTTIVLD